MIETKQVFNALEDSIVDFLIDHYENFSDYETNSMNKAPPPTGRLFDLIKKKIEECAERKLIYVIGNYYKHKNPYLPHTDFKHYQGNDINVVIPLKYEGVQPSLVVFDQIWNNDIITWGMDISVPYFKHNIGVKGCPHEYPVDNLTDKDIDSDFHSTYLHRFSKESLFGLSGKAYKFEPGSFIIFNNKRIHCTSDMNEEKLGLSLRFKCYQSSV